MFLVSAVDLGDACLPNDVCKETLARCTDGICSCVTGFENKNNACGKSCKIKYVFRSLFLQKHLLDACHVSSLTCIHNMNKQHA